MRARLLALASCLVLAAPLLAGAAAAQGTLDPFSDPASEAGRDIKGLFDLIWPISVIVGVLVEALLIYAVIRFRATKKGPVEESGERERGHHKLEIAWTIPPAAILLVVGLLSTGTLFAIENPGEPDFTMKVTGFQFGWLFEYPDGATAADELAVEAGKRVGLEIHATDVIHSFAVPSLGVKIDAIPGRVNHYSFEAEREGTYLVQCMEFCGVGHNAMRGRVVALPPGSTEEGYRSPGGAGEVNLSEADLVVDMDMLESGGPGGARPWSIDPATYSYEDGGTVLGVRVINPEGQSAPHNLTIVRQVGGQEEKLAGYDPLLQPGQEGAFLATLEAGTYTYYCAVPGHRELGMEGQLTVT